jgi:hypothetical protein
MALNPQPPQFTLGVDGKGRLICQEENLEPSIVKALDNLFLTVDAKFCLNFTLAASADDQQISFGSITDAKFLFVFSQSPIEIKINSVGSAAIPCCPYMLLMADTAGITELYLTNLGTATAVQVYVGA